MQAITEKLSPAKHTKDATMTKELRSSRVPGEAGCIEAPAQWLDTHRVATRYSPRTVASVSALTAIAAALLFAPLTASAADECGPGPTVTCAGNQPNGVSYTSAVPFSLTTTGAINAGANGFDITTSGAAGITFTSSAGNITGNGGVDLTAAAGTINAVAGQVAGHLRATTSSGAINIERMNSSGDIVATSVSGNIDLRRAPLLAGATATSGAITAVTAGDISIFSGGTGNITTNTSSGVGTTHIVLQNVNRLAASMNLTATVGSGGLIVDVRGITPPEGSGGDPRFDSAVIGVGNMTVSGMGHAQIGIGRESFTFGTSASARTIDPMARYARISGLLDFSALSGGVELDIGQRAIWTLNGNPLLSAGDDVVTIRRGAYMSLLEYNQSTPSAGIAVPQIVEFGEGTNRLVNEGRVLVGLERFIGGGLTPDTTRYEAELRLLNLDRFENDGEIWMGAWWTTDDFGFIDGAGGMEEALRVTDEVHYRNGTDRDADDILSAPGATFVGGANSRIFLDADLSAFGVMQDRCDSGVRSGVTGDLPAADCINLQNGASEGQTRLFVYDTNPGGRGAYNPEGFVVVDMSDGNGGPGTGAGGEPGNFVFDPAMRYYSPAFGGVLDNGMFQSQVAYDPDLKQFRIINIPSAGAHHQPLIANGAQAAWRTAAGNFFDRQADLRDTLRAARSAERGIWVRTTYDAGERQTQQTFVTPVTEVTYDNTHDLNTSAVTLGVDFLKGGAGSGYWLIGGMLGYVRTDVEYAQLWTDTAAMNGMLAGVYGSYVDGVLFVDATVSGIWTRLDQDMPQAELFRDSLLSTDITTYGAQVEAGWRFDLGMARVEPLLSFSHVMTSVDDFKVPEDDPIRPGNQVMFDDTTSTRAGLGLRGSLEMPVFGDAKLGLSLTGRYQQELDGEAKARIGNLNPISPEVVDEFDGNFGELVGGVTLADATGRVSGVLNIGSKFGDDYSALSGSFGFRYQW